jgi:AraC-like DNA-binding protein
VLYQELPLPGALAGIALCAWRCVMEPGDPALVEHMVPPDGTTNLVLTRSADEFRFAMLVRPSLASMPVPVQQGWAYAGLRLRPEAAERVTGIAPVPGPPEPQVLGGPLGPVFDDLAALIEESCDWSGTLRLFAGASGPDQGVADAVNALIMTGGTASLPALARAVGLGERQFRRRFVAATGVAPKYFADVYRMRRALVLALDDPDWAGIAEESGFADQPHLARDFRARFGQAPRRVRGYFGGIRHELLAPAHVRFVQDEAPAAA